MPNTETKWVKFGGTNTVAFLGKQVIAVASGLHVIFINLNTKDERVEKFDSRERGEGAYALSGHPVVPMFAISERRANPWIRVYTYPSINKVSDCVYKREKNLSGYLSSAFTGTDYLLTLTSYPGFKIVVWLWRTGEHLTTVDTGIVDEHQRITSSATPTNFVTQLGNASGHLKVYEFTVCSKIVNLIPTVNSDTFDKIKRITSTSWTYDGNLLLCDELGNVYLMLNDGKRWYLIVQSDEVVDETCHPLVVAFRGGAAVSNFYPKIVFYRKPPTERVRSASPWKAVWEIETSFSPIYLARHPQRDSIIVCTVKGEISEVSVGDDDIPRLQVICQQGSGYLFLFCVHPGRFVGAVDGFHQMSLLEAVSGKLAGQICLQSYGDVLSVLSHLALPLVAVSTSTGKCLILSLHDASDPFVLHCFYLIREPLGSMRFSWGGTALAAANTETGKIFVIRGFEDVKISVWSFIDTTEKLVDFLIYEEEDTDLRFISLIQTNSSISVGKYIAIYKTRGVENFQVEAVIKLSKVYSSLHYGNNFGEIIANPFLTKQLHLMKFEDNFEKLVLTKALSLSHRLRDVNINADTRHLLTFGYDGLVIIRNRGSINQLISLFTTHHRAEGGIKYAVACPPGIVITLGKNGNLLSSKISQLESPEIGDRGTSLVDAVRVLSGLPRFELNSDSNSTWIELREVERLERERNVVAVERASILSDFEHLRMKLGVLIDENERAPDGARLPLDTFDLDREGRARRIEQIREEQRKLQKKLEERVSRENEISEFLRKLCWDSMEVPACALVSLDGKIRVDNYALPCISQEEQMSRSLEKFYVDLSTKISIFESVYASVNTSEEENNGKNVAEKSRNLKLLQGDDSDEEEKFALTGTTTHRWIREDPSRVVNQILRHGSYTEGVKRKILGKIREEKLKKYFNKLFEDMRLRKSREIKLAKERISKIHHCSLELRQMFQVDLTVDHSWLKLDWNESEKPETVVKVEDEEVCTVINDSRGEPNVKHLDNSVTRMETSVYADEFRTEALRRMMDGVLEVKWEDEIKKDVPKPDCLSMDPANYTDEDLKVIEAYEAAVKQLEKERMKYRRILEEEIENLEASLKCSVENFNREMELFYLKRLKVESAVLQETLMRLRESQRHQLRLKGMEKVARLETEELASTAEQTKILMEESSQLEAAVNEMKIRYDNLSKRDKLLEGKFRGEFTDLKQPMVEHLLRQYKKRPRLGQLTCTSITYLTETGKCILSGEKSEILPRECLEFLKGMDTLDIMPTGLPSQIDAAHWNLLCKLRRSKVEIEIRLKSCAVELAEAEQTLATHQRTIQNSQSKIQQIKETIAECKRQNTEVMRNMEVQLVLKMGQIETNLTGNLRDLDNAVLVPFDEVLSVNDAIVAAGRKKLRAMRRTVEFRRTIEWREWRHGCMTMTLEDMKEELKTLESVKVTREIQRYLMSYPGLREGDKDVDISERSLASTKKRYGRILNAEKSRLFDIIKRVNLWQKRSDRLMDKIEKVKIDNYKYSLFANDETRARQERYVRAKLKAIMKRNRLIKKIQDNYGELVSLQTQLELLRLKTYPTLRLKDAKRHKKH